jgi:hypothetical protein
MWRIVGSGSTAKLSQDALSLEKTSTKEWMCAARGSRGWRAGRHSWAVRFVSGSDGISLGIANVAPKHPKDFREIDFNNAHNNMRRRYDVYFGTGEAVTPTDKRVVFDGPIQDGDVIMLCLDVSARTVHYGKDGRWMKQPVFTDLPTNGLWVPYFAVQHRGCSFTIIEQA